MTDRKYSCWRPPPFQKALLVRVVSFATLISLSCRYSPTETTAPAETENPITRAVKIAAVRLIIRLIKALQIPKVPNSSNCKSRAAPYTTTINEL